MKTLLFYHSYLFMSSIKNLNLIKMRNNIFYCFLFVTICSCSSSSKISNGAYSDISLNRDSKDYTISRLEEINKEEKAIFGIPTGKSLSKTRGMVVRFNGVNLTASKKIWPILSMVGLSVAIGSGISMISGLKEQTTTETEIYALGIVLATPIAGILNNQIWDGALSRAAYEANAQLLKDNDDIDVFLNPKYQFETSKGIFTQKAKINFRVMGAKIKTDN
jgi:hypothetical protein